MFRVMNKKRYIVLVFISILTIAFIILWFYQFKRVNNHAFKQEEIIYNTGEFVELDGDFFFFSQENTNGYSIKVNDAEIVNCAEFLKDYEITISNRDSMKMSKYIYLLNITIKNDNNSDGVLCTMGFSISNQSLYMPVDYEIWNIIDKKINGNINLKIKENTEATLMIPFSPQVLDESIAPKKLYNRMFDETFYFSVSDFPKRKYIKISN